MSNVFLKVTGLKVAYGGIQAVKGVDFEVREGELVSLIGSNGAGKTTTMKAITGILPINDGDIEYLGKSIRGQGPWDLVKQGLAMVPEGRGVFARMTITENLQMGAYIRSDKANILADIDKVFTIFPRLKERKDQLAGTLSGGEQQMLAMGRALMSRPKVLLLDEPSMGLSPIMVDKIFEVVADIHDQGGIAILPHPYAHHQNLTPALLGCLDGVEIYNGRDKRDYAVQTYAEYANPYRLATVANSDAHLYWEIGRACTLLDLERPITLSAVGACPAPLVEQILAHFIPGQFALLIRSSADLGILHQLGVEPHQLHAGSSNRAEMEKPAHPGQRGQDAMVERGSEPAVLAPPIEKARGAVARMALTTTSPDGPPREQSIADLASTVSQFAGPHHPIGPFLDDSDPGRLTTGVDF